jgi:ABC-type transporter Mla subunit MlaD
METIIEKDSPAAPLLILAVVFLFLLGGGLALAYMGGVFTGKNEVIANDKRIMDQAALVVPAR